MDKLQFLVLILHYKTTIARPLYRPTRVSGHFQLDLEDFVGAVFKTITVQLLLRFASLHQTGIDLQEDPTTCGSQPLNRIWDHWTSVLPTRGRRQPLNNTDVRLWTYSYRPTLTKSMPRRRVLLPARPYWSYYRIVIRQKMQQFYNSCLRTANSLRKQTESSFRHKIKI